MRRFISFLFDAVAYILLILVSTLVGVQVGFKLGAQVYLFVRSSSTAISSMLYVIIILLLGAGFTVWTFKRIFPGGKTEFTPEFVVASKWSFLWRSFMLWALIGFTLSGLTMYWVIPILLQTTSASGCTF